MGQDAIINRVTQVGLIGKVTFNQRCEGGVVSQANIGGKSIPCLHNNSAENPVP